MPYSACCMGMYIEDHLTKKPFGIFSSSSFEVELYRMGYQVNGTNCSAIYVFSKYYCTYRSGMLLLKKAEEYP